MIENNIYVTKSFLPLRREYESYLDKIWQSHTLTNNGPLVIELKKKLEIFLKIQNLLLLSNGTLALQIGIKALDLQDEVITTPFSYVATTSSLVWEGAKPIFVDIDPKTLNIDPNKIESKITKRTTGILATHVFGNPCNVDKIAEIASRYKLKVLYDAAHAFNVTFCDKPITNYGDASILSFHSTKIFHTIEGGAIVVNDSELYHKASYMSNFGHNGQEKFFGLGINAKLDEFRAAMGLCVLPNVISHTKKRKFIFEIYESYFYNQENIQTVNFLKSNTVLNYSYFPIILSTCKLLLEVKLALEKENIYARRYFYPSLSNLPYVEHNELDCSIAESISNRILCLPIYAALEEEIVHKISKIILYVVNIRES